MSDSDTDSDSDCKPNGYIVLCRTFHTGFRFQSQLPTTEMGSEVESQLKSRSVNVNKIRKGFVRKQRIPSCERFLGYPDGNGLFTLSDMDAGTDWDSDSNLDGYIVLCRICSHYTGSDSNHYLDSDPQSLLYPFLGWISIHGLGSESVSGNVNKP